MLDENILKIFSKKCILFKNIKSEDLLKSIENISYTKKSCRKNEIVALENEPCGGIGLVVDGILTIQKSNCHGSSIIIETLTAGDIFGEAVVFSNMSRYPATIICVQDASYVMVSHIEILKLCSNNKIFLNNFMNLLSNKILMLNRKIKVLSYQTIRQKVSYFIVQFYYTAGSLTLNVPFNRAQMSEYIGIPRPSLSRELISMKNDGIIDYYKNSIKILNLDYLKSIL